MLSTFYEAFYHKCLELIHDIVGNVFTNCSNLIAKGERYYKVGKPASGAVLCYYKVEQELLQSGTGLV